jgi:hypothetical protein
MSDTKKPNVFPTAEQIAAANNNGAEIARLQEEAITSGQVPENDISRINSMSNVLENQSFNNVQPNKSTMSEAEATIEMNRRTMEQLKLRNEMLSSGNPNAEAEFLESTRRPELAEKPQAIYNATVSQPKPVMNEPINTIEVNQQVNIGKRDYTKDVEVLSQQQWNQPYDIISLPSGGKVYKNKKGKVKVAFMTTADENILTSPNLLESGDFLEILINRKLLESDLRYADLIPGDRDAIMIWLRATGYGEMYPVTILDENDVPFETEVDLSKLPVNYLNQEPDVDGLFTMTLPMSKSVVKYKILSVGEVSELDKLAEFLKEENGLLNTYPTLLLENQIVEVDGNRDRDFISSFAENMRLMDSKALQKEIKSLECGVNTEIIFRTPGGGSVTRFLPFTFKFFWPEFEL